MAKFTPRGENYFKTTCLREFYEISYSVNTVADGEVIRDAFYSSYDKMKKAYDKMIETHTRIEDIKRWNLPDGISNLSDLAKSEKFHTSYTKLYNGYKLID